jgi:hypothetical protein
MHFFSAQPLWCTLFIVKKQKQFCWQRPLGRKNIVHHDLFVANNGPILCRIITICIRYKLVMFILFGRQASLSAYHVLTTDSKASARVLSLTQNPDQQTEGKMNLSGSHATELYVDGPDDFTIQQPVN